MMTIFIVLCALFGFIFGIHTSWMLQLIALFAFFLYMNSERVRNMELAVIFPAIFGGTFFIAAFVADIYCLLFFNSAIDFASAARLLFTP